MKVKDRGDRRWFVNSQGQTFAVIEGQVEFDMGSPPTEPDRYSDETQHRVQIPRRFAIAAKEVTVERIPELCEARPPKVDHAKTDQYSPDPKGPMNKVTGMTPPPIATGSAGKRTSQNATSRTSVASMRRACGSRPMP